MNVLLALFTSLCLFHLLLVLARFRFVFVFNPGGVKLLTVYLNNHVDDDLHIYFGYSLFDLIRWSLAKTNGRTEFQVLLTLIDNNPKELDNSDDTSAN